MGKTHDLCKSSGLVSVVHTYRQMYPQFSNPRLSKSAHIYLYIYRYSNRHLISHAHVTYHAILLSVLVLRHQIDLGTYAYNISHQSFEWGEEEEEEATRYDIIYM